MLVCLCHSVSEQKLQAAIEDGLNKEQLADTLRCMTNCGSCEGAIEQMLEDHRVKTACS